MRLAPSIYALLWSTVLWSGHVLAACPDDAEPTTASEIQALVEGIEASFSRADSANFASGELELAQALPCLEEVMPRYQVAAVHRVRGMRSWTKRDVEAADASFGAAKSIEPDFQFPDTLLPAGHPIRVAYDRVSGISPTSALPIPAEGTLWVNGRPGGDRPHDHATVLQVLNEDGGVQSTSYLQPSDRVPVYPIGRGAPRNQANKPGGSGPRVGWLVGSGIGLAAAGGVYGVAASRRAAYNAAPIEEKGGLRSQTNAWVLVSGAVGLSAIGVGVVAFVDGKPGIRLTW